MVREPSRYRLEVKKLFYDLISLKFQM